VSASVDDVVGRVADLFVTLRCLTKHGVMVLASMTEGEWEEVKCLVFAELSSRGYRVRKVGRHMYCIEPGVGVPKKCVKKLRGKAGATRSKPSTSSPSSRARVARLPAPS